MIHVIATIRLAPGQREAFLAEFRQLVPKVVEEQGCIDYGPTIDLETTIAGGIDVRDDVVTVVERWESIRALEDHLVAPHMNDYRAKVKDMVAGVELRILEPA